MLHIHGSAWEQSSEDRIEPSRAKWSGVEWSGLHHGCTVNQWTNERRCTAGFNTSIVIYSILLIWHWLSSCFTSPLFCSIVSYPIVSYRITELSLLLYCFTLLSCSVKLCHWYSTVQYCLCSAEFPLDFPNMIVIISWYWYAITHIKEWIKVR
jgi:hypothetical protein